MDADIFGEPGIYSRGFRLKVVDEWPQILRRSAYGSITDVAMYHYEDTSKGVLGPTWSPAFPDAQNTVAAWGSPTGVRQIAYPNASAVGSKALLYDNGTANTAVTLTAGFTAYEDNRPGLFRLARAELPEGQTLDKWTWTLDRFKLEIIDDDVWLSLGDTRVQSSLNVSKGDWHLIQIRPESWGCVHVSVDKSHDVIYDPLTTKQRLYNRAVVGSGVPVITSEGGKFAWASGNHLVASSSTCSLKVYPIPGTPYSGIPVATITIRGETPAGTNYLVTETAVGDGRNNLIATFTSDGKFFPLIHTVELYQAGTVRGRRSGTPLATWDSDDMADPDTGVSIVQQLDIQSEAVTRKMTATLQFRDEDLAEMNLPNPLGRLGTIGYDGGYVLRQGIIVGATPANVAKIADSDGNVAGKADSYQTLVMCDYWHLLELQRVFVSRSYDGMHLADAISAFLYDFGYSPSERAGLLAGAGPLLDSAGPLEDWAECPEIGATGASVILGWMDKYGEGYGFSQDHISGGFKLFLQPTIANHAAAARFYFSSSYSAPGDTFGGKPVYAMKNPVAMPQDDSDIYNQVTVVGDNDAATGEPIVVTATKFESLRVDSDPAFLGYLKSVTISDKRIKTKSHAIARARSELWKRTQPKEFVSITSDWLPSLFSLDRVWLSIESPQPYIVHEVKSSTIAANGGTKQTSWIARKARA